VNILYLQRTASIGLRHVDVARTWNRGSCGVAKADSFSMLQNHCLFNRMWHASERNQSHVHRNDVVLEKRQRDAAVLATRKLNTAP
jgi:hypothetical protein